MARQFADRQESAQQLGRPSRARYVFLIYAALLSFILYLDRTCIAESSHAIREELHLDKAHMGWVFAAFSFGYLLFEAPSGAWGDRYGPKRVLCRIVLCWSLFTALTGCVTAFTLDSGHRFRVFPYGNELPLLVNGFMILLLVRFLFGAGEAGAFPNLAKGTAGWFPLRERGLAQGIIITAGRIGAGVASALTIVLTDWASTLLSDGQGWRFSFWAYGTLGVAWAIAFSRWFENTPAQHPSVNAAEVALITGSNPESAADSGDHVPHIPWRTLLTSTNLWALSGAAFCSTTAYYLYLTWFPTYLKERHDVPKEWAWVAGLPMIVGAVGCVLGGFLTDWLLRRTGSRRWSRRIVAVAAKSSAALLLASAVLVENPLWAVVLIALSAFAEDLAMAPLWAVCTDTGGRYAATVFALMNTVAAAAAIISPLAAGYLLEHLAPSGASDPITRQHAWDTVLFLFAGMLVASAICWSAVDADRAIGPA